MSVKWKSGKSKPSSPPPGIQVLPDPELCDPSLPIDENDSACELDSPPDTALVPEQSLVEPTSPIVELTLDERSIPDSPKMDQSNSIPTSEDVTIVESRLHSPTFTELEIDKLSDLFFKSTFGPPKITDQFELFDSTGDLSDFPLETIPEEDTWSSSSSDSSVQETFSMGSCFIKPSLSPLGPNYLGYFSKRNYWARRLHVKESLRAAVLIRNASIRSGVFHGISCWDAF